MAETLTVRKLMEEGVHFGHRSSRWNPKMKPFIFMKRNLVHIIDLRETVRSLVVATRFLRELTARGGEILFVGTKRQARSVVLAHAKRTGMHYVSERWLGGTLTNFSVIRNRLKRLEYLEELEAGTKIKFYSKKMQASIARTRSKMLRNLEGIRKMTRLPDALVVVDPGREKNSVREAVKCGIPVIATIDTDSDPELIDIPIPSNDDAMRAISVIMDTLGGAILEGVEKFKAHVGPMPDRIGGPKQEARPVRRRGPGREGQGGGQRAPRSAMGGQQAQKPALAAEAAPKPAESAAPPAGATPAPEGAVPPPAPDQQ